MSKARKLRKATHRVKEALVEKLRQSTLDANAQDRQVRRADLRLIVHQLLRRTRVLGGRVCMLPVRFPVCRYLTRVVARMKRLSRSSG